MINLKIPKDLRKLRHQNSLDDLNYEKLKKKLMNIFKNEIKLISRKLSDKRRIFFKTHRDNSIFSNIIDGEFMENEAEMYSAKTHWDESNIDFFLMMGIIHSIAL